MDNLIHIQFYTHAGIAARKYSRSGIAGALNICIYSFDK